MSGFGPTPAIEADGLVLAGLCLSDAPELLVADRDPETARRFGWYAADASIEKCRAHIRHTSEWWQSGERAVFAVRDLVDGPLLGTVEAPGWGDRRVERSWMTVPSRRGCEVATLAVRAVAAWCFARGGDAIWALGRRGQRVIARRRTRSRVSRARAPGRRGASARDLLVAAWASISTAEGRTRRT